MTLVVVLGQQYLWDDVLWEAGSIIEVDDNVAAYQFGNNRMLPAPAGAKLTPKPAPIYVAPKATPQATGEAIAQALANQLSRKEDHGNVADADRRNISQAQAAAENLNRQENLASVKEEDRDKQLKKDEKDREDKLKEDKLKEDKPRHEFKK